MNSLLKLVGLAAAAVVLSACNQEATETSSGPELTKVVLMSDWYPQPEHGGFYQALAKGFYKDAGLDVEIRSGGGIRDIRPLVALRKVDIAIGTSDTTLIGVSRGLPLVFLAPYFQHDPQCVMFHPELGVKTLADLDNKVVMMQASLSHAEYMTKIMKLNLNFIPLDYSISRFATDKSFAQQCFLTSEPVHLAAQGIEAEVIPLSESGFDPYRHLYTSKAFLDEYPEAAKAFTEASIKGWVDFMEGDPTPALEAITAANPQQQAELMTQAMAAMKKYHLVDGFSERGEVTGTYQKVRLNDQIKALKALELIDPELDYQSALPEAELPSQYQ
ncbi:ABC transporter substrate-binding protein [Halioxenophilus sp. WMMB6]|uniref:ABC transporter substrate-binding protein n=1 Tax=Halioxenophilus sp. WMMB6 TaxID=3073815 RepID=UPI00295E4A4D|nr:ABC transporter substrate-binding protein [Halioxenophilus sp. WMMB6]